MIVADRSIRRIVPPLMSLCVSLLFIHPLAGFSLASYGDRLSVEDCVEVALRHNPGHQKVRGDLTTSSANLLASYGNFLPTVNVGYGLSEDRYFNPTFLNPEGSVSSFPLTIPEGTEVTHTIDPETGEVGHEVVQTGEVILPIPQGERRFSGGQLQISETLFRGGANIFGLWKARHEREASRRGVDASELELTYQVKKQYYAVLAGEKRVELAREVLEQRAEQLRLARARHDVGSVTMLDVMQAEIDRGSQENTLLEEQNTLKVARMELNRLMGIPLETEYGMVEEFDTFEPDVDALDLVERAKRSRPDLIAIESREEAAENEIWVQRAGYLPTLSFDLLLFRSEQGAGSDPFTFTPKNRDTRLALNLDWQFFSGFSRLSAGRTARVDLENLRYDRRETELLVEKEVKEAVLNLERVYKQSLTTRKNRQLATENLRLEQERYRLGSSSLLDLRSAQVTFIEAETEHINKVFEFNSSFAALERATGMRLKD